MTVGMAIDEDSKETAGEGLAIVHKGNHVRLKWHRLRRRVSDPLFNVTNMQRGFRLGASMEIDLRVRRDGGFVVLHDETLDGETTGTGAIADHSTKDLRQLHFRDRPRRSLLFSEDLAAMLKQAHPDALLQFDMKDDLAAIGAPGLDHLAALFADSPASIIVSGASLELIVEIANRLPNLLRGIDPTDKLVELHRSQGLKAVEAELRSDLAGSTRPDTVYLAWQLILQARKDGLDLVELCHREGKRVDAWTFTLKQPGRGFSDREWSHFAALLDLRVDQISTDEAVATERAYRKRAGA